MGGIAQTVRGAASHKLSESLGFDGAVVRGQDLAWKNRAPRMPAGETGEQGKQSRPGWAQDMQQRQDNRHHRHLAVQALREGDRGGAAALPDIEEKEN
jgi:type IV secretion system protein TrbL